MLHARSRPLQLVNPHPDDMVGGGVAAIGGVVVGTAPPWGEDMHPVISRARTAMHSAGITNEVFIRASPWLNTKDTSDVIYGFISG